MDMKEQTQQPQQQRRSTTSSSSATPPPDHRYSRPSATSSHLPDSPDTSSSISSDHSSIHAFSPLHENQNSYSNPSSNHISIAPSPEPNRASPVSQPESPGSSSISSDHTFHGFSPQQDKARFYEINPSETRPASSPPVPSQPAVVNRLIREDQGATVTKIESDAATGFADEVGGSVGTRQDSARRRQSLSVLKGVKRNNLVKHAALGLRVCEFVTCLISFSVMASDKNRGWALDSFDHYMEFRYSLSVNVLGFVYSALQAVDIANLLATGKQLSGHQLRPFFDFALDQILAYLLVSASSSAGTRVGDWISNWGNDKFPAMAAASVGMSCLAFVAFAFSSLISGYVLCTRKTI